MQTRMSCRCNGRLPDRGAGASGRTDQAGMGEGCSGDGEGPGHMPLDQIEANMKVQQSICQSAVLCIGTTCDKILLRI